MAKATDGDAAPVPQRLLAAATRLFAEQGYDRTSVQEIVEAAGVTKGALYHYFGSKEDLLQEVYSRMLRLQQERLDAFAEADAPVEQRLRDAAADVVVTTIDNLDDAAIFFRSMHHLSPEKNKQVRGERRRYHERFRALIEEGQRSGVFSTATPGRPGGRLPLRLHPPSVHLVPAGRPAQPPGGRRPPGGPAAEGPASVAGTAWARGPQASGPVPMGLPGRTTGTKVSPKDCSFIERTCPVSALDGVPSCR
ncbi:AcrR family transcriptional regulator [Streptomyces sp. TE33382]